MVQPRNVSTFRAKGVSLQSNVPFFAQNHENFKSQLGHQALGEAEQAQVLQKQPEYELTAQVDNYK